MASKPTRHSLEIHEPGSIRTPALFLNSDTPFMGYSVGDFIHPAILPDATPATRWRVTEVEHMVWDHETHNLDKLLVYTEEVDEATAFPGRV